VGRLAERLRKLEASIWARAEQDDMWRAFYEAAPLLDRIAACISHNPKWDDVAAQVAEHHPELDAFATQIEVKRRLIEADELGSPELAEWFMAASRQSHEDGF
jgi:hypothetical protein